MEFKTTNHAYSCEQGGAKGVSVFKSWKEFKENGEGYDLDLNLPFRFDITKGESNEGMVLSINHALQRHGTSLWHVVIQNLKPEDMPEVSEYLSKCKNLMTDLWKEVPLDTITGPTSVKIGKQCIKRIVQGQEIEIELTEAEMLLAYQKVNRVFKIQNALQSIEETTAINVHPASLSEEQGDLLERMENAFQDALHEDVGVVWDATFDSYREEYDTLFPNQE